MEHKHLSSFYPSHFLLSSYIPPPLVLCFHLSLPAFSFLTQHSRNSSCNSFGSPFPIGNDFKVLCFQCRFLKERGVKYCIRNWRIRGRICRPKGRGGWRYWGQYHHHASHQRTWIAGGKEKRLKNWIHCCCRGWSWANFNFNSSHTADNHFHFHVIQRRAHDVMKMSPARVPIILAFKKRGEKYKADKEIFQSATFFRNC